MASSSIENIKQINSENLSDIRNNAKASFLSMIDTLISSYNDNISITLKESDKNKIRVYYYKWYSELENTLKYIYIFFIASIFLSFQFLELEIEYLRYITNNEIIIKGSVLLLVYVFFTFALIYFSTLRNIEHYFYVLYSQIGNIEHKNSVLDRLLKVLFTKQERETKDYKKFIYGFVVLFVFMFFASSIYFYAISVILVWFVLIMNHDFRNNIILKKG